MAKNFKKALKSNRFLIVLLLSGLLLRLVLSIQIYSGDMNNYIAWAKDSLTLGFSGIYEREFFFRYGVLTPNYPPIPLFFFTTFYWLYEWVYQSAWSLNSTVGLFPSNLILLLEDQDTLPAFLKIPAISADLGLATIVFIFAKKLVNNRKSKWPFLAAALVLFNPAFFYNSASWGQIEAIPLFFVLVSFYLLLYSKKYMFSSLFFTLALLSKQTPAVFVPLFILAFLKSFGFRKSLKAFFASVALFWLTFLPFYKGGNLLLSPFSIYWQKIQTASVSDYVTDHAFNFWALISGLGKISDSTSFWLGLPYSMWGYIFFGVLLAAVLYVVYQKRDLQGTVLAAAGLSALAAFLFLTRMHERHLEQALPFLLLVGLKNKKALWIFLFLSVFHFINLYHNWWAPRIAPLVEMLSQKATVDVLILVAIGSFFLLFVQYLKGLTNE